MEGSAIVFEYQGENCSELGLSVGIFGEPRLELERDHFSDGDYQIFTEYAEKSLEEFGELEKPYTLLEQVDDYA